ncbi:tRNA lysidine(34) synthetase TilS [Enterococcus xiangfangensis]|uniref:tRNA lysidine(34) synthetase TilS n=1 Tax=Enterococcus xiangfangensis TaxID=1296537 RepID=UPI003D16B4BE|nr:tRNA lysidine(34) synthetase TilS [Enterococcus asini]
MEQVFFQDNPELLTKKKLLLAVSTGVDSMVLLHLLEQQNIQIGVVHVDHQLRPESKKEAAFLQNYCRNHQLPFYLKVWEQPAKENIEAEARKLRYAFFEKIMIQENYELLLTAHHGDDQLETLLMRLVRGGSLIGHSGIARQQSFGAGSLLRPLLSFSKEEIYAYAKKEQLTYFEDATNASAAYFRNRIRQNVVPGLKKENPQILLHAQQFHQQLTWADQLIAQSLKENLRKVVFDGRRWFFTEETLPENPGARYYFLAAFFQQAAPQTKFAVSQKQLFSLLEQLQRTSSQWAVDLGEDWQFIRRYQRFYLELKASADKGVFHLTENEQILLPNAASISLRKSDVPAKKNGYQVPLPLTIKLPLTVRKRAAGDRIALSKTLTKRIGRYFIDRKIPTDAREDAWVVTDATGEVVALLPFVNSYLSIATETDRIHYILDYALQVAK